jgi:hypothetical protein
MTLTHECAIVPQNRIQGWQDKLAAIVRHIQPWWMAADHIPIWVRNYSRVRDLVAAMEGRVEALSLLIIPVLKADCRADGSSIARIENELEELTQMAGSFDQQLREEIPQWQKAKDSEPAQRAIA